jgi:hypothetical protein
MSQEIFLLTASGFDFKLCIGDGNARTGGLIGNYIHRYVSGSDRIAGVVPISHIDLNKLSKDKLPLTKEAHPRLVEHNVNEINKYFALYKEAFHEAIKHLK